jgi:TonB family protein
VVHRALAADGRVPEGVTAASLTTSDLADVPPNLAFGRELAARVLTKTKPKQSYALTVRKIGAEFDVPSFGAAALSGPLHRWLTKSEREGLHVVEASIPDLRRPGTVSAVDYPGLRTVGELPDGYVADVLTQSGCTPKEPVEMAGAIVRYTQAKHLQELQWTATGLKPPSAEAARLILAASLLPAPVTAKPGDRLWVMLPMREQFLRCLGRATGQNGSQVERVGRQGIVPPRKIRDVRPEYPPMALTNRRQGLVIIEAGISAAGCVDRAEVKRGAAMDFDLEALRAVTGWAFTPTLLDGRPVPVIMTVTVGFGLN